MSLDRDIVALLNLDQFSPQPIYVWASGTLWYAQRGGVDPSILYTSTDYADVLEQVDFDEAKHVLRLNEAPDLELEII